jgi:hypothetical protein
MQEKNSGPDSNIILSALRRFLFPIVGFLCMAQASENLTAARERDLVHP